MISLEHVGFRYRSQWVLDNIDFFVEQREFVGLIGPNGGGKSTLVKVILGLLKPQKGSVKILGKPATAARNIIGYVPQFVRFNRDFPAQVNAVVSYALLKNAPFISMKKKRDVMAKVENVLSMTGLSELSNEPMTELSGGQVQRVLLARALVSQPKILILDEPTANIDMHIEKNVFDLLKSINKDMAIIVVSHDVGFISDYVTRVACLNKTLHWHTPQNIDGDVIQSLYDQPVNMVKHYHGHHHE